MKLSVISPQGIILEKEVEKVSIPGSIGGFTVLSGHAPLITQIKKGKINYTANGKNESLDIENGIAEVKDNIIHIITQ